MRSQTRTLLLLLSCLLGMWSAAASAAGPQKSAPKSSQQDRWDAAYRDGRRAPWDISRPATDLKQAVENGTLRPCRVVELGCGPGNDAVYLAGRGFDVTAIDIAPTALSQAEKKAREAGVKVRWLHADVLNPPKLEPFDLIYDRGCYHGLRQRNAAGTILPQRVKRVAVAASDGALPFSGEQRATFAAHARRCGIAPGLAQSVEQCRRCFAG